jgi:plasmid stability protein
VVDLEAGRLDLDLGSLRTMLGLLIKNLPMDLLRKLEARASANRRSLSDEAISILDAALHGRSGSPTLDEIDRLRVHGRRPLRQEIIDLARRRER